MTTDQLINTIQKIITENTTLYFFVGFGSAILIIMGIYVFVLYQKAKTNKEAKAKIFTSEHYEEVKNQGEQN